jgi:transmembrane sensor
VLQANGDVFEAVRVAPSERLVLLNDGSRIRMTAGASLVPLSNSGGSVVVEQDVGHVQYDIAAGGSRRWAVECGAATIEGVGTSFEIDRAERGVTVRVARGLVLVRDHTVADRVIRLTAGMTAEVSAISATPKVSIVDPSPAAPRAAVVAAPDVATSVAGPKAAAHVDEPWRAFAAQGKNDKAYAELGPNGIALKSKSASVEDLFDLADVARLSGHPAEALDPLQRIVLEHAKDARAPLAALTAGRIQLRSLLMPALAARSLEKAIALGVPTGLGEDTYALLVEALSRSGDEHRARAAYETFSARFPASSRSAELRTWVRDR